MTMRELGMEISDQDVQLMIQQADCKIPGRIYYEGTIEHNTILNNYIKLL